MVCGARVPVRVRQELVQLRSEASQRDVQLSLRDGLVRQLGALASGAVASASVAERTLLSELQASRCRDPYSLRRIHSFAEVHVHFAKLAWIIFAEVRMHS